MRPSITSSSFKHLMCNVVNEQINIIYYRTIYAIHLAKLIVSIYKRTINGNVVIGRLKKKKTAEIKKKRI